MQRASLKPVQQKLLSAFEQRDIAQLRTFANAGGERDEMQSYITKTLRGVLGASPQDMAETERMLVHAYDRVEISKDTGTRQYVLKLDDDESEF